jgi:hypothetical protein
VKTYDDEIAAIKALQARPDDRRGITEHSKRDLMALGIVPPAVDVLSDREAADAMVLCLIAWPARPLLLRDNLVGACDGGCGRSVQCRPHVLATAKRVCAFCLTDQLDKEDGDDDTKTR